MLLGATVLHPGRTPLGIIPRAHAAVQCGHTVRKENEAGDTKEYGHDQFGLRLGLPEEALDEQGDVERWGPFREWFGDVRWGDGWRKFHIMTLGELVDV